MNISKIAVRYATALFDLALEKEVLDDVYWDMKEVGKLCSMQEVKDVIDSPVITHQKRKEIMLSLIGEKVNPLTVKFIDLVFKQGREEFLGAAARNFIDLTRHYRGIREVTLTTAVPVGESLKTELAEIIEGKGTGQIEFIEHVDKSVIGGFILRVDDAYIDASVRNRLNRFRKEFSLAGYTKE
jgi:F-type H+-transporting ATPase subunit delta